MISLQKRYLELLKCNLIDYFGVDVWEYRPISRQLKPWTKIFLIFLDQILSVKNFAICRLKQFNSEDIIVGKTRSSRAETMVGLKRLNNIQECFIDILNNNIQGDLIETGAWRGGGTIFMRALLEVFDVKDRKVWVADSFEGLPNPNGEKYEMDKNSTYHAMDELSVSLDQVKKNFQKYGFLDEQVHFLKGWFKDTLPDAPIDRIALLRLDGDMYESTMDALTHLYPKLSKGGYILIDDYGAVKMAKQAVKDYRNLNNISEEIKHVDWTGVYWKKAS